MASRTLRNYFLDSSCLTKLFIVEPGSTHVRSIVHAAGAASPSAHITLCDLAHPEAAAALRQVVERGEGGRRGISPSALKRTLPELASAVGEGSRFSVVQASTVITHAADIAARRRVKGADAVHLAAAWKVFASLGEGEEFWFVSADVRQAAAAREEGMPTFDLTS